MHVSNGPQYKQLKTQHDLALRCRHRM